LFLHVRYKQAEEKRQRHTEN